MLKLLLVEDNEMNRDMLSRRLKRKGYDVILAEDGEQAIQLATETMPDLILMDMSLPVIDGWEAAKQVKQNPTTAHIPIIAQTAHAMANDREKCLEAGCDDYTPKPIHMGQLLAKIEALLLEPNPTLIQPKLVRR